MRILSFIVWLWVVFGVAGCAQPTFTAQDKVNAFPDHFDYGVNLGYFPPHYEDKALAALVHGTPDGRPEGFGVGSIRVGLFSWFLEQWGYDARLPHFRYYDSIGIRNVVAIIGFPSEQQRESAEYCPGARSALFAGLYEPIWDNGENGTPVNEQNTYALSIWKAVQTYKGLIKVYEVWNEPDIDLGGNAWKTPGMPGNWWEQPPAPCDLTLKAPVFHYIRLLRISWEIVKSVDPQAFVAVGGLGWPAFLDAVCRYTDNPDSGRVQLPEFPLKGGAWFDCMSFHAYPHLDNSMREWRNELNGFYYYRHSDAGIDGLWRLRARFDTVLQHHGFNNLVFPQKTWICTEYNIPRKTFGDFIGSDEAQSNFIVKSFISAQMQGIKQMHLYSLADEKPEQEATGEFAYMGLFKNLNGMRPFQAEPTEAAWAYKTTATLLASARFDPLRTAEMALPKGVRGAAFVHPDGTYTYTLWAECRQDRSEAAAAGYTFPASWPIRGLTLRNRWYAKDGQERLISGNSLQLDGGVVFVRLK